MTDFFKEHPFISTMGVLAYVSISIHTTTTSVRTREIKNLLEKMSSNSVPALVIANTIGNSEPEKFYTFGTNRAYVEIDGKSIEKYTVVGGTK